MFTNREKIEIFGNEISKKLDSFNSFEVTTGYFGSEVIERFENKLIGIAKRGFCKILIGDKSDNLKPIINKCGIKTAINYYNKKDTFDDLLAKNKNCKDKYEQNRKLIDFNYIPSHLCDEFYNNNLQKIL